MFLLEEGEGFVDIVEFYGKFWLPYVRHFISLLALGSYEWYYVLTANSDLVSEFFFPSLFSMYEYWGTVMELVNEKHCVMHIAENEVVCLPRAFARENGFR